MSLLDTASLIVTPNGTKASKLYSVVPSDGSGDMTVTRATTATRVNSAGLIETVASNVPRLDYSNGTCPSILVEPQRTNLVLNSETLATQSISVTAQSYTLSFYGSGTVTLSGTHSSTVVGLGTARKTYTFTPTAGTLILTISGTCTKGQLEAGSYATSYIPTTSSIVTRNADLISKSGISSLTGTTEGAIFCDFVFGDYDFNGIVPLTLYNDSLNNIYFFIDGSGAFSCGFIVGGSTSISISTASGFAVKNTRYKIALAYKNNDFAFYINGNLIGLDTSGSIVNFDNIALNYNFPLGYIGLKNIINVSLWKTRLTNSQLAQLTTI